MEARDGVVEVEEGAVDVVHQAAGGDQEAAGAGGGEGRLLGWGGGNKEPDVIGISRRDF